MSPAGDDRSFTSAEPAPAGFFARWCRPFVLLVLFAISAAIVWTGNAFGWPAGVASALVGGFTGLLAGGIVGVSVLQTFAVMTVFVCTLESGIWGAAHFGWPGAILAPLAGVLVGHILGSIPLTLVLIFAAPPAESNPADGTPTRDP